MLTERRLCFVAALRVGLRGRAAAVAAGYSPRTAAQAAWRLSRAEDITEALAAPATALERAAAAACDHRRRLRLQLDHLDGLAARAVAGNANAQISYLSAWRREQRRSR